MYVTGILSRYTGIQIQVFRYTYIVDMVYLAVILIWQFGESRNDWQIKYRWFIEQTGNIKSHQYGFWVDHQMIDSKIITLIQVTNQMNFTYYTNQFIEQTLFA